MFKILNQSDKSTEILLYSLITGGMTANQVIKALNQSPSDEITLRINSDGGEVFEAVSIYNYLKDKNVHVIIDGMCASAASIIAMCGKHITMKQGSMLMIHNPFSVAVGDSDELRQTADVLDKITASMAGIYASRTGKSPEKMRALMDAETWMTDAEAKGAGFIDEIEQTSPPGPVNDRTSPPGPLSLAGEGENAEVRPCEGEDLGGVLFNKGVNAERERLRLLDELNAPGREAIINRAKYQTHQTAQDIAIELLKAERPAPPAKTDPVNLSSLPAGGDERHISDLLAQAINNMRGE